MARTPSRGKAHAALWGLKASAFLRWRLRELLRMLPARGGPGFPAYGAGPAAGGRHRIAYLFSGTYGDFAQILGPLNRLASAFPQSELILWGGEGYLPEFASELPASLRRAGPAGPWRWITDPVDLLFSNCVGVYRVRFDIIAALCARSAYGFRHAHEDVRGGYGRSLPLGPSVRNFAEENLRLLDLAAVPSGPAPDTCRNAPAAAWGKGGILFLIGSAGLKKDFGLETYSRLVVGILKKLSDKPLEVVAGPGDADIASRVRRETGIEPVSYPLPSLIHRLRSFEGAILCFNSFSAHICHYLDRNAIVLHRETVPYGYDCAPLHRQIVLMSETGWDLGELWKALDIRGH